MSEPLAHELTMTVLMAPDIATFSGSVHGGTILKLLDQVMFRQPIQLGELATFLASVNHTGNSSMEVGIKVVAEDIRSQVKRHANSCFFPMGALGDDVKPVRVPPRGPSKPDERRRFRAAVVRRQLRQELEQRSLALRAAPDGGV
jgi:acyl-CoA hydrolase